MDDRTDGTPRGRRGRTPLPPSSPPERGRLPLALLALALLAAMPFAAASAGRAGELRRLEAQSEALGRRVHELSMARDPSDDVPGAPPPPALREVRAVHAAYTAARDRVRELQADGPVGRAFDWLAEKFHLSGGPVELAEFAE